MQSYNVSDNVTKNDDYTKCDRKHISRLRSAYQRQKELLFIEVMKFCVNIIISYNYNRTH